MSSRERWNRTWDRLGLPRPADSVFDGLIAHYGEPHRAYHTLDHIQECFVQLDSVPQVPSREELELALWFHDVIYDTHAHDNEEQSAEWGRRVMLACDMPLPAIERVDQLILVTKHDAPPGSPAESLMIDIDLAILGATKVRFDEYEAQVRQEYAWVPEDVFRSTRAQILKGFECRPRIYHSDFFFARLETPARDNLARSLAKLMG